MSSWDMELLGALSWLSEVPWEESRAGNGSIRSPDIYFTALNSASCLNSGSGEHSLPLIGQCPFAWTLGMLLLTSPGCLAAQIVCCANVGS